MSAREAFNPLRVDWDGLRWQATESLAQRYGGTTYRRILDAVDDVVNNLDGDITGLRRPWLLTLICDRASDKLEGK